MLHKDYFILDSTRCLFFKLLSYKTHSSLALGPSTMTLKFPLLLAPLCKPPCLPGHPGHLSFSRRCQSAAYKSLIFKDTPHLAC